MTNTIKRIDGKETKYARADYEAELVASTKLAADRIGEIVIDISDTPALPTVWVANVTGHLNPIGGGGTGGFSEFVANGVSLLATTSPTLDIAPAQVEFCMDTRPTVGIDLVQATPTANARLEFRVTPTGVPIDNPFSAPADFGIAAPDFATLGNEISSNWLWDLSKNPLAGMQCYDLGLLP